MTDSLTIRRPDDWHVHLRDGGMLTDVVNYTARQFARAIVMPNLTPPVTTVEAGKAYRQRILNAANATTNSSAGVTDVKNIYPVLEAMSRIGMPFLVHGEVTHQDVDIFDREAKFIGRCLSPSHQRLP